MTTLAARVLEAIEAAVRVANSASGGPWTIRNLGRHDQAAVVADTGERTPVGLPVGPLGADLHTAKAVADARHIAHNDPAAVLRRCAADRRIVETYLAICEAPEIHADAFAAMTSVLKDLAEGYGVPLEQEET